MAVSTPTTFRFGDLPIEIRNKVYRELLCSFKPRPTTINITESFMYDLARAHDGINTAILRTSKAVYREAYDVMVKTNRFVKVTSTYGIPLRPMLNAFQVQAVSSDQNSVDNFKGYVLAVDLQVKLNPRRADWKDEFGMAEACNLMLLHRDMGAFCQSIMDGDAQLQGFSNALKMSIKVAPNIADSQPSRYTPSIKDFFSKTTQKSLLAPLRTGINGYKGVKISGHVDRDLAKAIQQDMNQDSWSDPNDVLESFIAEKDKGTRMFQQRELEQGCLVWQDATLLIDKMRQSSSWPTLVKRGGERFVSQLAEPYYLVRLNIAHIQLATMQRSPAESFVAGIMAEDALKCAYASTGQDYWMKGYKYEPSLQHGAKLFYRYAMFLRLEANPDRAREALTYITDALGLQPGDPVILKERDNIVAWMKYIR